MKKLCDDMIATAHSVPRHSLEMSGNPKDFEIHIRATLGRQLDQFQKANVDSMCHTCTDRVVEEESHRDHARDDLIFRIAVRCKHGGGCPYTRASTSSIRGKSIDSIWMDEFSNMTDAADSMMYAHKAMMTPPQPKPINRDAPLSAGAGDW